MRAKFLRVGPSSPDGRPTIELEMADGESILVPLDRAHARSVANRLLDCIDGGARRTLELELAPAYYFDDEQLPLAMGHA